MKKTELIKKTIATALSIIMVIALLPFSAFATDSKPSYVALGDSISTGYGLADKTTQGFANLLANSIDYELTNLAVDGNTAAGILAQLNDTENTSVSTAVAQADLITITAGGNDLMAALYQALADYYNTQYGLTGDNAVSGNDIVDIFAGNDPDISLTLTDINALLGIVAGFANTQNFTDALESYTDTMFGVGGVIETIRGLNSDVEIVLATQYNPYAVFDGVLIYGNLYTGIEAGLSGEDGLNEVIESNAYSKGCYVADVYTAFKNSTSNLCNAGVVSGKTELDFHPNAAGHEVLAAAMKSAIPETLATPAAPAFTFNKRSHKLEASWTADQYAFGYEYELYEDDDTTPIVADSYIIYDFDNQEKVSFDYVPKSHSTYKLRIRTLGNEAWGYKDSAWSEFSTFTYIHYDPIIVGGQLLNHGDKYEISDSSYASYEGTDGKAVLRLVNFNLTADDIDDIEALPEKGYEFMNGYSGRRDAMINTHLDDLTIILEGTNSITCGIDNYKMIQSSGNIIITSSDNGKLKLYSEEINVTGISGEMVAVKNCELDVNTTAYCITSGYDYIEFVGCDATLITSSESNPAIPYFSMDVDFSGCIAVGGADKDNTERFERPKSTYKYIRVSVPDSILATPTNLRIDGAIVSWDAVEGACGYKLEVYEKAISDNQSRKLDVVELPGTDNVFYFGNLNFIPGYQYYFRVSALGNGTTTGDSGWAESEFYECGDFFIVGINVKDKHYLYNDGTVSTTAPTDPDMGYAYYQKGETDKLTLSNFKLENLPERDQYMSFIIGARSLDIELIGNNVLASENEPSYETFAIDSLAFLPQLPSEPEVISIKITGQEGSTLTTYSDVFFYGTSILRTVIEEPVTVNVFGTVYSDYLEVHGKLYVDYGIYIYQLLTRGENGYISAKLPSDNDYGAIEFYSFDDPETSEYDINDYLALNGGVIVDGNGDALVSGYYMLSYSDDYSDYAEYWYTFYDPDIAVSEHSGENSSKHVIICSENALASKVTVEVEYADFEGSVTGAGEYDEGDSVTLTATPGEEMKFEYWLDASAQLSDSPTEAELRAAIVSYDATYTFTARQDIRLEAVFSGAFQINITPMLINGTDDESLFEAEWWDIEHDFGSVNVGPNPVTLPGEFVEDIVTIGDKQYKFEGFIRFSYDEATDTELVELKKEMTISAMPLYDSEEYWDWISPISDGVFVAYMEYTPDEEGQQPQNPNIPQGPVDSEDPKEPQNPSSPYTGDNNNLWMWVVLMFISSGAVITLTAVDRKKIDNTTSKR